MTGCSVVSNGSIAVGSRRIERRRPRPPDQLPIEELQQMPALIVLERLPAPALAVDRAGTVLFANASFCDLVGYSSDELVSMNFDDFFCCPPADDRWVTLVGTGPEGLVELRHKYGHSVWAGMSKSAMRRRDDTLALVTFRDRTEELWLNSVAPELPSETAIRNGWPSAGSVQGARP
ncbi:MAG TPA: PAS domain-containing protein [Mycobacterium sp.]|nr:PAS domain-containing protein [Mycobacterium sp.]